MHTPCIDLPHIPSRGDRTRPQWLGRGSSYWHTPMTVSLASAHTSRAIACPQGIPDCLLRWTVILKVIPPAATEPNQTGLTGIPTQPDLAGPYWSGLSGEPAITISDAGT